MQKRTPLYNEHIRLLGKMVDFAGYELPVQYSDVQAEHMAVRNDAGIFDVSHMGEFLIEGEGALDALENLLTAEIKTLDCGKARYSLMLNENGGIIDDLLVYCLGNNQYWLVVNAANRQKDLDWVEKNMPANVAVKDISEQIAQIALQGPKSKELLKEIAKNEHIPKKYYAFVENAEIFGCNCLISRTGYTGSFGYEIYCKSEYAEKIWQGLLASGEKYGILPCGLGARDTLRIEAAMCLYGNELNDDITPFEAGLDFAVKMSKDFIGKAALVQKGEPKITRVGVKVTGRGIAREDCSISSTSGETIGKTTSGTFLPYAGGAFAMALINKDQSQIGNTVSIDVRGRQIQGEIVEMPFFT